MDRHSWHKVYTEKTLTHPASRWGHSSVVISEEVVFFGGYADSNYMNDVWSFNTVTMSWHEIKTTGDIPSCRSNCSMNYDKNNHKLVVFGGGGPNKKRFNSINLLDWHTKEWREITPKINEAGPWERTYHSSQLFHEFLVVFGGEGVADLDDLWVYNFKTNQWLQMPQREERPCARRFHSSVLVDSHMFVIAGCHGKYRCLNDIFCVDLSPLLENGCLDELQWKEVKVNSSSFLTRWGHTSVVYDRKIYIFGGRFSNDLNDILVVDVDKLTMKALKVVSQLPKARRRHSAVFVGSCMLVFGGFNGEYFNDLHYINVFEVKSKMEIPESCRESSLHKLVNNPQMSDHMLTTSDGERIPLHKGLIHNRFQSREQMQQFLQEQDNKYNRLDLLQIVDCLYTGVGHLPAHITEKYHLEVFDSIPQRDNALRLSISADLNRVLLGNRKHITNVVIPLSDDNYEQFLEVQRLATYTDLTLVVNNEYYIPANRIKLALNCRYFSKALIDCPAGSQVQMVLARPCNIIVYEILLNYLQLDLLVVPAQIDESLWMVLFELAEYYCLGRLMAICENMLISKVTDCNCEEIMLFALQHDVDVLLLYCAEYQIKLIISKEEKEWVESRLLDEEMAKKKEEILNVVYNLLRFDIDQRQIQKENALTLTLKNEIDAGHEKENQNNELSYHQ